MLKLDVPAMHKEVKIHMEQSARVNVSMVTHDTLLYFLPQQAAGSSTEDSDPVQDEVDDYFKVGRP